LPLVRVSHYTVIPRRACFPWSTYVVSPAYKRLPNGRREPLCPRFSHMNPPIPEPDAAVRQPPRTMHRRPFCHGVPIKKAHTAHRKQRHAEAGHGSREPNA